ncbi:MAG: hypothetical protein ABIS50_22230 [Luteolibacter sp.]|uniref:hypothetical protein n=1 Tax=Luteolibacter sp. TaxID=1962973 RepID=UPI003262F9E6
MKIAPFLTILSHCSAIVLTGTASALTPLTDNFNAETLRLARWKITNREGGELAHFPGGMKFTVGSDPAQYASGIAELRNRHPGCNESWEVIVDVVNKTNLEYRAGVGLQICNALDARDRVNYKFNGAGLGGIGSSSGFAVTGQADDEVDLDDFDREFRLDPQVAAGSMRITFDKKTRFFTFWYDRTGRADGFQWMKLCNYSTTGRGGYRSGNWRMNPASGRFTIQIYGYSDSCRVPAGQLKLDNFSMRNTP